GPRLRMICNGDEEVNALRSELSATVQAPQPVAERYRAKEMLQRAAKAPGPLETMLAPPSDQPLTDAVKVSCFVRLADPARPSDMLPSTQVRRGELVTVELTPREIEAIADLGPETGIAAIETGEPLALPHPVVTPRAVTEPPSRVPNSVVTAGPVVLADPAVPAVLIGIVDVGGFDFAHPDFLTTDVTRKTRFVSVWDQGAPKGSPLGPPPAHFTDGAEITGERMNRALEWSRAHKVGATDLLRQSSQRPGAHATHVASIAAGNKGVCPEAAIAGVLIALTEKDKSRHASLYDSTRLAHAVDYLFGLGERLYGRRIPTVINISLGTNGHAHDGTSAICQWIDAALMTPGRCVCVAAGNAGQEAPQFAGDLGFLMGRIHASGQVAARGLETNLEWQVVGNGIADVSENELEIWYEAGDEFEVRLRSPSGVWIGPVRPGEYVENRRLPSETFVSIYSQQYNVANGANRISIILSPRLKAPVVGIEAGTWLVRFKGVEVRSGRFDAWIERDDPRPLGRIGEVDAWRFPSYFSQRSNVDRSSVSSLACGHRVISVGNCEEAAERINRSSSQGPTRDGRYKPEIAAPGTDVIAARGFAPPDRPWIAMSGTSMASPYVAGVAAHMLAREPRLTAAQVLGIMRRTAQPLPGSDYRWQDAAGFGLIQPDACLTEIHKPFAPVDLDKKPVAWSRGDHK
ncbi:MAG TPA: S8 family serine peptidase, partial [Vicinamibacterales bacterium]|nr:S8 family serine peptidase [Vicinamibacterales bacterium]